MALHLSGCGKAKKKKKKSSKEELVPCYIHFTFMRWKVHNLLKHINSKFHLTTFVSERLKNLWTPNASSHNSWMQWSIFMNEPKLSRPEINLRSAHLNKKKKIESYIQSKLSIALIASYIRPELIHLVNWVESHRISNAFDLYIICLSK